MLLLELPLKAKMVVVLSIFIMVPMMELILTINRYEMIARVAMISIIFF